MKSGAEESAQLPPQVYETRFRVRYAETDQMGVVYHSNYIIWFEVGRVEMFRQLGFTYSEMEQQESTRLAVVDVRCRYKNPARYDEALLAEGETVHLVLGADMKRTPLPQKYLAPFRRAAGRE